MQRLTERDEKGFALLITRCADGCKYGSIDTCNHECDKDFIEKLAEYEDLEEQGLLLRLPCKVGDTVYHVVQGRIVEVSNVDLFFLLLSVVENRFNNSVFLTQEEAEKKLKEMESDNNGTME